MDTIKHIKELIKRKPSAEHFQKIISALRGPDMLVLDQHGCVFGGGIERLKYLTTGRIRAIVAPGYNGSVTHQPLTEGERFERNNFLKYSPEHYSVHYQEAVEAIKVVFGYDLKHEVEYIVPKPILPQNSKDKLFGTYTPLPLPTGTGDNLREAWRALGDLEQS